MPVPDLNAKVLEYEAFVNQKLKKDLQRALDHRAEYQQQQQEWDELLQHIRLLQQQQQQQHASAVNPPPPPQPPSPQQQQQPPLKSRVDLGCGVYCQAVVPDPSRICISVGLGFHVEATLEEALGIIELQQQRLERKVADTVQQAAQLKAHIKFVVEAIAQLTGLS